MNGTSHARTDRIGRGRRGALLLQVGAGAFASAAVLSAVTSLYVVAERQSEVSTRRARITAATREIASRLRQDIRSASAVTVTDSGSGLEVTRSGDHGRGERVSYTSTAGRLTRTASVSGRVTERQEWSRPAPEVRFARQGPALRAELQLRERVHHRDVGLSLVVTATPRSGL